MTLASYAIEYPLGPLGGLFVTVVGLFVLAGSVVPKWRMALLWVGLPTALLVMTFSGGPFARGIGHPSNLQIASLVLAIIFEVTAFVVVMRRVRRRGERLVIVATLAIVAIHFLFMAPAFGPIIVGLALLCLANAGVAGSVRRYAQLIA